MQSLLQSAFLQALGYAIFNSLWQMALLWIIVMIINSTCKLSSAKKYFTGVIAQFAGFAWFVFTLRFYYVQCREVITNAQAAGAVNNEYYFYEPVVNSFSSGLVYTIIKIEQLLPYLSVAYLFMLLFLSIRLTRAYVYTRKIRTTGLVKPDVDWKLFVKRTAGYLGIHKEVTLWFSELVKSPLTLGFAKPLILVPVASLNHLTADQLEAILLHELAHIKRADYLINIIQSIIEIVLFFNPFTQLLGKLIKKERENSCDDWVLQFQYKPAMYAEALLRIAYIQTQPSFALQAASGSKGELLPRVKRMLNQQEKSYQYRNHLFALLLITIMLTTVAWFNPSANKTINHTEADNSKKVLVEPFTAKVDNPLFNPIYIFTKPLQEQIEKAVFTAVDTAVKTLPVIKNEISKATPLAIESIRKVYSDIDNEIPGLEEDVTKAVKEAQIELSNIKINGVNITDSSALGAMLGNMVQHELAKVDWSKVNSELAKTQIELASLQENAGNIFNEPAANTTLNQVNQLKLFNNAKVNFDAPDFLKNILEKRKTVVDEQKKVKEEKEKTKRLTSVARAKRPLRVWSDMKRDDYSFDISDEAFTNITNSYNYEMPATFTTAAFNDENINEPEESCNNSDSAIIIVQHNPDNDKSHVKHIKIQIIGNDGTVKNYTVTVDVYQ